MACRLLVIYMDTTVSQGVRAFNCSLLPQFLNLITRFFRRNADMTVKITQAFMCTDFHDQLYGSASKEFVGTKGTPAGRRVDPFALWLRFNDILRWPGWAAGIWDQVEKGIK